LLCNFLLLDIGAQKQKLCHVNIYFYFPVKELTAETDDRAWYTKLEDYEGHFEFVEEDGKVDTDGERGKKNCVI
jgi:hypothetical protein